MVKPYKNPTETTNQWFVKPVKDQHPKPLSKILWKSINQPPLRGLEKLWAPELPWHWKGVVTGCWGWHMACHLSTVVTRSKFQGDFTCSNQLVTWTPGCYPEQSEMLFPKQTHQPQIAHVPLGFDVPFFGGRNLVSNLRFNPHLYMINHHGTTMNNHHRNDWLNWQCHLGNSKQTFSSAYLPHSNSDLGNSSRWSKCRLGLEERNLGKAVLEDFPAITGWVWYSQRMRTVSWWGVGPNLEMVL